MELIEHLALGFQAAATLQNITYAFVGCLLGTLIGVLPGLGPLATISLLLPFTYGMEPLAALIMLAGIYYGSQYGGSTTAILVNLPGETSSVVTTIDGHQMALQGRAGVALVTAAIGSFFAGCVGTLMLAAFALPLSRLAISFGPAEYFSLMFLGLVGASVLSTSGVLKSMSMLVLGLLLGMVGTDVMSGVLRFTFGSLDLWNGLDLVAIAVGIFAITEIVDSLDSKTKVSVVASGVNLLRPTMDDFRRMVPAILRGTGLGAMIGVLPGSGPAIASFMSYTLERRLAKDPSRFGKGAIEGVAGPESANNAAAQCSFVPTLTLGVPGSATMALLLGAMTIHNIQPGPQVITRNPDLFWGLIASMWIGNLMLVILNLPLVGIWVKILHIPYRVLYPAILVFCCIGVYSVQYTTFSLGLVCLAGIAGYVFRKIDCSPVPLMLGFILGPMIEQHFRRAMILSHGDFAIFIGRPMSAALLLLSIGILLLASFSYFRRRRMEVITEDV